MPNMSIVIKQHSQKVLSSPQTNQKRQYNCKNPANCLLDGKCLTKNTVYKTVVSTTTYFHTYYSSSKDFKFLYNIHTKAFHHQHYKNNTELSKHMWDFKSAGIHYNIAWSISARASAYRCGTRICDLCITEKYIIARANQKNLLNKRIEIISIMPA